MFETLTETQNGIEQMGKLKRCLCFLNNKKLKIIYFLLGLFSFIWILIRIIPKPSRATYPCVQAAYPFAGSFLVYLAGLLTSAYAYTRALANFRKRQYFVFFSLLVASIISSIFISSGSKENYAATFKTAFVESNKPMGEPKGVIPGRVVWFHHPGATDENWII